VQKGIIGGRPLTPMQVNKLSFLAHGYCLATMEFSLFEDAIHAWKYGPVVTSVYIQFKHHGRQPIDRLEFRGASEIRDFQKIMQTDSEIRELLDTIWDCYGHFSGSQLSTITHEEGSPWDVIWNHKGGKFQPDAAIPNSLIWDYYQRLLFTA
jgi:uncharacterized phage-associated protein